MTSILMMSVLIPPPPIPIRVKGDISCRTCVLGYKMLATTCDTGCGTIELEDKRGKKYCVACEEVDCEENR